VVDGVSVGSDEGDADVVGALDGWLLTVALGLTLGAALGVLTVVAAGDGAVVTGLSPDELLTI
jgi:hypothetical protein